ncbi:MAG: hypothetical protein ABWY05_10095 [Noviherbaspirillum sp.]
MHTAYVHFFACRARIAMRAAPILAALFLIGGCASPLTQEGMVPTGMVINKKHHETVRVAVSGGSETSERLAISNASLEAALNQTINESRLFSQVVKGNGGDYLLTANLFSMDQPMFGMAMTVKLEAGWTLKRASDSKIVWQEAIWSEHTSTPGEAFAGVTRVRLATEGAVKNNIAEALSKIATLPL